MFCFVVGKRTSRFTHTKYLRMLHKQLKALLIVYYNHCGMPSKSRTIAITDAAGNVLKKWTFGDAATAKEGMSIPVKELLALQEKHKNSKLAIHYTAKELPKGLTLAGMKFSD